jgi:hypothetical protein
MRRTPSVRTNRTTYRRHRSIRFGAFEGPDRQTCEFSHKLSMRGRHHPQLVAWQPAPKIERRLPWWLNDTTINFMALVLAVLGLALVLMLWYGLMHDDGGLR